MNTNYSKIPQYKVLCNPLNDSAGPSGRAVCGRSPAEIVGSNPVGGTEVFLL
jgi:hypothetical protein